MRSVVFGLMASFMMAVSAIADELWVAFDLSDSSPLLLEDAAAMRGGVTVAEAIRSLKRGDTVFLRSFGEAGVSEQQINLTIRLVGNNRPKKVARDVQAFIASLPELTRKGTLKLEHRTNVMGWLERAGPTLNCQSTPTRVIALTDGIEWSGAIRGDQLLSGAPLPPPSGAILEGCLVEFWGVGQQQKKFGNDDRWYPILRKSWTAYMADAGAAKFVAYAKYSR